MKLYTKTGDKGETGLIGGKRVSKCHLRVTCYGDVDELNTLMGLVLAVCDDNSWCERLQEIQSDLFILGSQLATAEDRSATHTIRRNRIGQLEEWMDRLMENLDPLKNFVLPGGSELSARCHHARAVCRRAERSVVQLSQTSAVEPDVVIYLNRLSDLLFALSLAANQKAGVKNHLWIAPKTDP